MTMKKVSLLLVALIGFVQAAQPQEMDWPQEIVAENGAVVVIYQPQVETFSGNTLEARAAVSVKMPAAPDVPVFGAIWIKTKLDTNRDTRNALLRDIEVSDVRFADANDDQKDALADLIESGLENTTLNMTVDELLADLDYDSSGLPQADLKHTPPEILLSREPAMLVSIDGDPVFQGIDGTYFERVVNSAFLIVRAGLDLYLYVGSNTWYASDDVLGPWTQSGDVPEDITKLVEPVEGDASEVGDMKIIIATEPTELIVSAGPPAWAPVEGMDLLYMSNTDSNAFLELTTQKYYVLLSGRWFAGEGIAGELEWVHVPNDELPLPFGDIPPESVNGAVLSQVAGTQQAREAVLDNTIPQTAAIDRDDASFSVEYDGDPDFAPIEDIQVQYAQNTTAAVFKYGNLYYACDDGVWYVATTARGPWSVATEIPDAIYKIPASNPYHNVTYVKVYDVTPEVVYVGYTPSYYGSYYYHGTVIYGTGWYYRPWYGPYYYPRYPTWGFHVRYNPWYGWGFGVSWTNGPFRFSYGHHGSWWGVGGYRPYSRPVHYGGAQNRPSTRPATRPATRPNVYDRPENRARNAERPATANNQQARPANNVQNNVLTDRSGNVYQRGNDGSWAQRQNGQWSQPSNLDWAGASGGGNLQRPSTGYPQPATRPQLERDYGARQQGAQRSQNFQRQGGGRRRR
jgi:hypothetical protein